MDIINYREVDKLEEHLRNRTIQEALLREESIEWALDYDKEHLGKNFAIAYGLNVADFEKYKTLNDLKKADKNDLLSLCKTNLKLAELFYDEILPFAKVYSSTWNNGGVHYEKLIANGTSTVLKMQYRTHGNHGTVGLKTKTEGDYADSGFYTPNTVDTEVKIVNKYENLTIYRNNNSCENAYPYVVWYI